MQGASDLATAAPEPADIVGRARALIPSLVARSREGRQRRRIPEASIVTWQVSGPQAPGSWDIVVEEAFVPAYRSQSMLDNFRLKGPGQAPNTSSLYRLPFGQIFVRGISTAALGGLQGMLNAFLDYGKTRVTRAGGRSAENPFVQLVCAESAAAIDEMTNTLHRNLRNLHAYH